MATKEINTPIADTKTKNGSLTPITGGNGGGNNDYNADSIKVLGGMEAVRKRPAMYIGSTGELGLHHLVYEVVDNSVDEALAGYATRIDVTLLADGGVRVVDDGRGIPVDDMDIDGEKISAAQVVMTTLHAGGKFDASSYKVSGGLHGVGVSCVNALSEELELEIWRDGGTWQQTYSKGDPTSKLKKTGVAKVKTGTKVHFLPDRSIFTATEYNYDTLAQRLRELAFLNKGLLITLTDERTIDPKTGEAKRADFKYNGGIAEFIKHLNRGKQVLHDKPIYMEDDRNGVRMEIGLQYNDAYSETLFSFANNINTVDGGTHLSGFRTALTRTINYAGQQLGLFKDVKENLTGDDVREGLVAVISVKLPQPQFEGQTKGKLNSDIAGTVTQFVNERLGAFFEQNSTVAKKIIQVAQLLFMSVSAIWGVLFLTNSLQMWHAMVLLTMHGLAGAIWAPAEQLMLHDLAGRETLPSAVRLNSTGRSTGFLAGPAIGSVLLLGLGPAYGIFANILFYLPLTLFLFRTRFTGHTRDSGVRRNRIGLLDSVRGAER